MYTTHRTRTRFVTISCLCLVCLVFLLLLTRDAADAYDATPFLFASLQFGFSTLVAAAFLSIGALVWYYGYHRRSGLLLFGFTGTMAITFAVRSGARSDDLLLSATASISSLVALLCLNALLLIFPTNNLGGPRAAPETGGQHGAGRARPHALVLGLRGYLCAQAVLCIAAISDTVLSFLEGSHASPWLPLVVYCYGFAGLVGALVSLYLSYRYAPGLRERQQLRLLLSGTAFAIVPFLILTLVPFLLGFPPRLVVDSQISTATCVVLALALGYAMLRYQLLCFEASVRRLVATLLGLLSLVCLAYLIIAVTSLAMPGDEDGQVGVVVLALVVLGSLTWWGARTVTERLVFSEISHYRKLFSRPERLTRESFDLDEAARLVADAAGDAFEAAACVFLLDEESGCYRPYFPLNRQDAHRLAGQVFQCVRPVVFLGKKTDLLDREDPVFARLGGASRPLHLSELCRTAAAGRPRWPFTTQGGESDPLLAPLWANGEVAGVLVLGARSDGLAYAGPDFEVIDLIQRRYTPVLETARLYALDSTHAALVLKLFTGMQPPSGEEFKTLEAVARDYAKVIASAAAAGAEVWLVGESDGGRFLRRLLHLGPGPTTALREPLRVEALRAQTRLTPAFLTWQRSPDLLEELTGVEAGGRTTFSCAWLPLLRGEELRGVLVLNYARPHTFSTRERRLLGLFANQCAAALENTRVLLDLNAARAGEIESDRLRDQFVLAASRGLRLPLTTVGGYIEMARLYSDRLSPEARSEFLAHAQRSANEMVLLVSTIMDALQLTAMEQAPLEPVALLPALRDILEMLQARRLSRDIAIRVEVPANVQVLADAMRLRQILLNLLSTALVYASARTVLEVSARDAGREVMVCVRCFGSGVPPQRRAGLFEPFADPSPAAAGGRIAPGFSISKQQVERMGGHLWVASSPGENEPGIIFAFTLRTALVQEGSQVERLPSPSRSSEQPG